MKELEGLYGKIRGRPRAAEETEMRRRKTEPAAEPQGHSYHISSVAKRYGIHPQTLRLYEREGLLKPSRSEGNTRLYSDDDLKQLEVILNLIRDLG